MPDPLMRSSCGLPADWDVQELPTRAARAWRLRARRPGVIVEQATCVPRPRRIRDAGLVRHVMARGNGRMRIFLDDSDYQHFIDFLGTILDDLHIECWSYCLMPNHYHLALRPTRPNLSKALHALNGAYAHRWNRRYHHVGHVFQGRFKDQIVQEDGYLLTLCRYIALNPVRGGLTERPQDWPWSSYAASIGLCPPPEFLSVDCTLQLFGLDERAALQARFAAFVTGSHEDRSIVNRLRSRERIVGDRLFKAALRTRLVLAGLAAQSPGVGSRGGNVQAF